MESSMTPSYGSVGGWLREKERLVSHFIVLCLALFSLPVFAIDYTFATTWWGGAVSGSYPPCTGGSWSLNGSTWTCSGSIQLDAGDTILPASGRTIIANAGITLNGSNTVGSAGVSVNLQTGSGDLKVSGSGNTIYGNLSASSGAIDLSGTSVSGSLSTNGKVVLNGGSVSGNVSGKNGITTGNGTAIGGNVLASNGVVSLTGGSVAGSVRSDCCTVTTTNTNVGSGISSGSSTVTINGGTVAGAISTGGGSGIVINNATVTSGSITATNVPITITNSTIGSSSAQINVKSNNVITLKDNTTVYGNVNAGTWSDALVIDSSSQVVGDCTPTSSPSYPRCKALPPCSPPANIPSGVAVTCQCDSFTRSTLNPSSIFNADWLATESDSTEILPRIANSGYLRLTENTVKNAKAATVPGIFPAAGNYISIEFNHYAYNGSSTGGDGMAVTLSDYTRSAKPGAYGGSLGYAQKTGISGFASGWVGVALDEYGNYQNPTEGRQGGPGAIAQSVALRGSGSGTVGYRWLAGTDNLTTSGAKVGIDNRASKTPAPGYRYQVIVDARNDAGGVTSISVNRDTSGAGTAYSSLISVSNIYDAAKAQDFKQDSVPNYWQISFSGSTGDSYNIHEIGALRICAQSMLSPTAGVLGGFNIIDEAYARDKYDALRGHIYAKLVGTSFKLNVAALNSDKSDIESTYASGGDKSVKVELIDDSGASSCNVSPVSCSSCGKQVIATQTMTFKKTEQATDKGFKKSADFTLNKAYSRVIARATEGKTVACSTDAFSVRPLGAALVASANASPPSASSLPKIRAGEFFKLEAKVASSDGYTGVLKLFSEKLTAQVSSQGDTVETGGLAGTLTPESLTVNAGPVDATYSEVGYAYLEPGTYRDDDFTSVDSENGDCVKESVSNTLSGGKFGCSIGNTTRLPVGRFIPYRFDTELTKGCPAGGFTYAKQAFPIRVSAKNFAGSVTQNYAGAFAKQVTLSDGNVTGLGEFNPKTILSSGFSLGATPALIAAGATQPITTSFVFSSPPQPPTSVKLRATDTDGVTSQGYTEGETNIYSGRLWLGNAHGSELLPLPIPVEAQFWQTGDYWATNSLDNCTSFQISAVGLSNPTQNISLCKTQFSPSGSMTLSNGRASLRLTAPGSGNNGSVDLALNAGASASGKTCVSVSESNASAANLPHFLPNPAGRASFGVRKAPLIYRREIY